MAGSGSGCLISTPKEIDVGFDETSSPAGIEEQGHRAHLQKYLEPVWSRHRLPASQQNNRQ
jgi:hypothetical protein